MFFFRFFAGPSPGRFQCPLITKCHRVLMTLHRLRNLLRIIDRFSRISTCRERPSSPRSTQWTARRRMSCQKHRRYLIRTSRRRPWVSRRRRWRRTRRCPPTFTPASFTVIQRSSAAITSTRKDSRSLTTTADALSKSTLGCPRDCGPSR